MAQSPIAVLLVDDDPDDRLLTGALFAEIDQAAYHLTVVATYDAGLEALTQGSFDVCLVDQRLGARDGLNLLGEALARGCRTPLILLTGCGGRSLDEAAMRLGAADYLVKSQITAELLERTIRHSIERAHTLQALRDSDERFRLLVDGVGDHALFLLTPGGHVATWNAGAERMSGYTEAEIVGEHVSSFHSESDRARGWPIELLEAAQVHGLAHDEGWRVRKDGSHFWAEATITALRTDSGELRGYAKVVHDITDRRRVEEQRAMQLAASLDYETTLQQVAGLAVPRLADWCTVDVLEGDGSIQRVAAAHADPALQPLLYETLWRYPIKLHEPRGIAIVLRTGQPHLDTALSDADLRTVARDEHHLQILRALGPRSSLSVPLVARGQALGTLSFSRGHGPLVAFSTADLTWAGELAARAAVAIDNARQYREARAAEERLLALEAELRGLNEALEQRVVARTFELEQANHELESFSYSVSHDLRAPLRAINGFSRIVLEEHTGLLDDEGRGYIESVRDNAQQMGRLIDDLLAFSRLGRQGLITDTVQLDDIARQALADLVVEHTDRQLHITIASMPSCQGDPALLRQVFVNLLSNALKYSRKKEVARIEVGHTLADGEHVYWVRDNGVGFDMRYANKLFGVFQRLHRAEDYEGTGVGLALVQRIVQRHGGRVWAASVLGQGATFFFTLGGSRLALPAA